MRADYLDKQLAIAEGLVSDVRVGMYERADQGDYWGTPGKNSDANMKDKLRIARGIINSVAQEIDRRCFRD